MPEGASRIPDGRMVKREVRDGKVVKIQYDAAVSSSKKDV